MLIVWQSRWASDCWCKQPFHVFNCLKSSDILNIVAQDNQGGWSVRTEEPSCADGTQCPHQPHHSSQGRVVGHQDEIIKDYTSFIQSVSDLRVLDLSRVHFESIWTEWANNLWNSKMELNRFISELNGSISGEWNFWMGCCYKRLKQGACRAGIERGPS